MKFLRDKQPYYIKKEERVGSISVDDGILDITDPGYERDCWCTIFDHKVKPGKYDVYVTVVNFPSIFLCEDENDVANWRKPIGKSFTVNDRRLVRLTIAHEDYSLLDLKSKRWNILSDNIGVDAGMCGFYNHKPNYDDEKDWTSFWQSLKNLPRTTITCDLNQANGVTVSSGWGDGIYTVREKKEKGVPIALELVFN